MGSPLAGPYFFGMIDCKPTGICSFNYLLSGDGHSAHLKFNMLSEHGQIAVGPEWFEVRKHGPMSGEWSVDFGPEGLLRAKKESALSRSFSVLDGGGSYRLSADSPIGRAMSLRGPGYAVHFKPSHALTRRASITGQWNSFHLITFAFWLAALMWKREQQSSSG